MQYVGRFVSSVYNTITPNINPATLSGAIDVIVVERQVETEVEEESEWGDEGGKRKKKVVTTEMASSPFHVRFGKMSVLRPAERKVRRGHAVGYAGTTAHAVSCAGHTSPQQLS